jgi:hypothetical protein
MHTLKYQFDDYETPSGISYKEVSLESQPDDIRALNYIPGLCLLTNRDDYGNEVETIEVNLIEGGTTKKDKEETKKEDGNEGMTLPFIIQLEI